MTHVPVPTLGPNGYVAPTEAEILAGVMRDLNDAFGGNLNQSLATPQGQLATSTTAIVGDSYNLFLWFTQQVDPAYAEGRMQDGIARIYFIERIPSAPTVVSATCRGLPGVQIPLASLARADDDRLYISTETGEIGTDGTVEIPFACTIDGPIACPAGSLKRIYSALNGWDSITNAAAGVLGRDVENRAAFEERRRLSTAINAMGILPAILGATLAVEDVLDGFVTENITDGPMLSGGVWLAPHSLYVCALGGEAQAIGEAIWSRKAPGCNYNGDTVVTVVDPNPAYSPPAPSYEVRFQRPDVVGFAVLVIMRANSLVPDDALTQVQTAVVAAFAGTDGGTRARIGTPVFASRYYGPVTGLGDWAEVLSVTIGRVGAHASIVGSINGQVLTVASVSSGNVSLGDLLSGTGVEQGTYVTALGTATGTVGTYLVSVPQNMSSSAMTATSLSEIEELDIDEAPSLSADNVHLFLELG